MSISQHDKWVLLSRSPQTSGDADGYFEDLSPSGVWASIAPIFGATDSRTIASVVEMRYHPQVTVDTRLVYGTRQLFVRGVQHIAEANDLMRLYCEEVQP